MNILQFISKQSYPELTRHLTESYIRAIFDRISTSVRNAPKSFWASARSTWGMQQGGEGKLTGKSEHAEFSAFDYHIKVPARGFEAPEGKSHWIMIKPGEVKERELNYSTLGKRGRTLYRNGWLNDACKMHLVDFGVSAMIYGPNPWNIIQYPAGIFAKETRGGINNQKVLANALGITYANKIVQDIVHAYESRGYTVKVDRYSMRRPSFDAHTPFYG